MTSLSVIGVARPNFLLLTPLCLSLGVASAQLAGANLDWLALTLVFFGALMAHVSVNALNEYADFRSGLDFHTRRTPFSGGTGTLVRQPELAPGALLLGLGALTLTLSCGIYLLLLTGWELMPIGLIGILLILFYSGPIGRNRYLVLIAPGLGFGPLMVLGTHYVLSGSLSTTALMLSLVPFFQVNNLLLMNQIPDIPADRQFGRDNFAIALGGAPGTALLYGGLSLAAYLSLIVAVVFGLVPGFALLGLLTLAPAYEVYVRARRHRGEEDKLPGLLGLNVAVTLATPLLISLGIGLAGRA